MKNKLEFKTMKTMLVQDSGVQLHINIPAEFVTKLGISKGDIAIMNLRSDGVISLSFLNKGGSYE